VNTIVHVCAHVEHDLVNIYRSEVHVWLVVDKVALGQLLSKYFSFSSSLSSHQFSILIPVSPVLRNLRDWKCH